MLLLQKKTSETNDNYLRNNKRKKLVVRRSCLKEHESACYHCLRLCYVENVAEYVEQYPLKCYHPDCNRLLKEKDVQPLFETPEERQRYRTLSFLAANYDQFRFNFGVHVWDPTISKYVFVNGGRIPYWFYHLQGKKQQQPKGGDWRLILSEIRRRRPTWATVQGYDMWRKVVNVREEVLKFETQVLLERDRLSIAKGKKTKNKLPKLVLLETDDDIYYDDYYENEQNWDDDHDDRKEEDDEDDVFNDNMKQNETAEDGEEFKHAEEDDDNDFEMITSSDCWAAAPSSIATSTTSSGVNNLDSPSSWEELSEVSSVVSLDSFPTVARSFLDAVAKEGESSTNDGTAGPWAAVIVGAAPKSSKPKTTSTVVEKSPLEPIEEEEENEFYDSHFFYHGAKGSRGGKAKYQFNHQPMRKYYWYKRKYYLVGKRN